MVNCEAWLFGWKEIGETREWGEIRDTGRTFPLSKGSRKGGGLKGPIRRREIEKGYI